MPLEYVEISSRYTRPRDELDREHLAKVKAIRSKRKKPKNHATSKERSLIDRRKHAEAMKHVAEREKAIASFKVAMRAYWLGQSDSAPRLDHYLGG